MKLRIPSKSEAADLIAGPDSFLGFSICAEALPPAAMLKHALSSEESMWCMPRLFCIESTRQIVGSGAFKSTPREKRIEIGYGVSPVCRRKGHATEGFW